MKLLDKNSYGDYFSVRHPFLNLFIWIFGFVFFTFGIPMLLSFLPVVMVQIVGSAIGVFLISHAVFTLIKS
jgi:hypothetical protein